MYYVYVLYSLRDKKLYTGCTSNLRERILRHNRGLVSSTMSRRPLRLIYYEMCLNEVDAFRREKYLKSGMGKRWIKKRLKFWLKGIGA